MQERIKDFLEEIEQSLVGSGNNHEFNPEGLNEEFISSNNRSVLMSRVNRSIGQIQDNVMKKDSDSSEVGSMESCNTYSSCFSTFHSSLLDIPADIVNLKDCFTNKMINQQHISQLPSTSASTATNVTSKSNQQIQVTNKTDSALATKIVAELTPQTASLASHSLPGLVSTPTPTSTPPPPHPLTLHLASLPVTPVTSPVPPSIESISSPSTSIQAELTRSNEIETNHESDINGDCSQSNAILTTDDQAPLLAQNVYINPLYKSDPL